MTGTMRTKILRLGRASPAVVPDLIRWAFSPSRVRCRELLRRFKGDQSGSYLVITGLMMPALIGFAGLGTELGLWYHKHQTMQSAADSAAVSAATAYFVESGSTQLSS